ncbi:MAG: hypothetical protein LBS01_03400 [Prevotellaceae bacterium]|jgi:hypothetical protein|nr:hypothetical protein [Prevotellaceae bacterium]
MKKGKLFLFALMGAVCATAFTACGGDDDPEPQDHTLNDKGVFLNGNFEGEVTISNNKLGTTSIVSDAAVEFSANSQTSLLMTFSKNKEFPRVVCSNFMESADNSRCWFTIENIPAQDLLTGEVPQYMKDWYADGTIIRIERNTIVFSDVSYNVKTKKLSFKATTSIKVIYQGVDYTDTGNLTYMFNLPLK